MNIEHTTLDIHGVILARLIAKLTSHDFTAPCGADRVVRQVARENP
jgi:hypothetical protein